MSVLIAGIGDLTVDTLLFGFGKMPEWGHEIVISQVKRRLGGNLGNFSQVAVKLGMDFIPYGPIGQDDLGMWLIKELDRLGIPTTGIVKFAEYDTSQTFALIRTDGERLFLTMDGALIALQDLMTMIDVGPAELVYLTGWCIPPRVEYSCLMHRLRGWRKKQKQVAMDLSWYPESWSSPNRERLFSLFQEIDYLFLNHEELKALMNMDDVVGATEQLAAAMPADHVLIVKYGSKGALVANQRRIVKQIPTLSIKAKDTVGAGDLFNAAFLHATFNRGMSIEESVSFGCVFSSITLADEHRLMPEEDEVFLQMGALYKEDKHVYCSRQIQQDRD